MHDLLTLAMSETTPGTGDFKVIVYSLKDLKIYSMDMKREDFHNKKGEIIWNIGAVTRVEELVKAERSYNGNILYVPSGNASIIKEYTRQELRSVFKREKISPSTFKRNAAMSYAIFKVDFVEELSQPEVSSDTFKHRVSFMSMGEEQKKVLNKDFRWLNYWKNIYEQGKVEDKLKYFRNYINNSNRENYVIMYRHRFSKGIGEWIVGFHML